MIERNEYLKQLIDKENNGMIKIITGIRRCDKSYLLEQGIKETRLLKCNLTQFNF